MYKVIGYELDERCLPELQYDEDGDAIPPNEDVDPFVVCFEKEFENLEEAERIAEIVAERISDVYGMAHVDIEDLETEDIWDTITGPYNASISMDLSDLL